jgi:cytochrome c-type biogenesis protein CcmH/NrfG
MTPTIETPEQLEAERDFLLQSLDDLEAERAAGAIDDESYRQLHDDYTARAAAVIRALRDGIDTRPVAKPAPARRWITVAVIVGFAVAAGVALAAALGARLPGQTSSGNSPQTVSSRGDDSPSRREVLERAVERDPSNVGPRLLLAQNLEAEGDLAGALQQYDEIVRLHPDDAEAYAHAGRILYITAQQAPPADAAGLVEESIARLDKAVDLDSAFVEARYFRAIVRANEFQDFAGAQGDLQRYLVAEPNGRFADDARALLAQVTEAMQPATTAASP